MSTSDKSVIVAAPDDESDALVFIEEEDDLSDCPYFARYFSLPGHDPEALCSYGCQTEPSCVTDQPSDGWPSQRAKP